MFYKLIKIIFILCILIYAVLLWSPSMVYADTITGKARVIDGDTIEINNIKMSLKILI